MVRSVSEKRRVVIRRGAWTPQEDALLINCIQKYGEGKWRQVPLRAGLNRCRKSCRLRWLNYLHPSIKRGEFAPDEVDLIIKLHKLLGNRWSLIAGRIPGRTANDIKNYWNSNLSKKLANQVDANSESCSKVIKPKPFMFPSSSKGVRPTFHYCGELQKQPQQQSLLLQQQQELESLSSLREGDFDRWKSLSFAEGEERGNAQVEGFGGMGRGSSEPLGSLGGEDEWDGLFTDPDLWRLLEVAGENQSTGDI